jgi:predicted DNA-binding transcriptional regulator YafY
VGKEWTVYERRAEIMRILESRRSEIMSNLAFYFDVSIRTICYDIDFLAALHPVETVRGEYGCVKLIDGYREYQNILSREQQETLIDIIPLINSRQAEVVKGLLRAHGSKQNKKRIDGLII